MALENVGGTESTSGISRLTREYLYWVLTTNNNFADADCYIAFVATQTDKPEDVFVEKAEFPGDKAQWLRADWVPNPDNAAQNALRLLVGPGPGSAISFETQPAGSPTTYRIWARFNIGDEAIVRRVGTLLVR